MWAYQARSTPRSSPPELTTSAFIPQLQGRNDDKYLPFCCERNGVPLCFRSKINRGVGSSSKSLGPWKDKVGLHAVANKTKHGNPSVLYLGLTEPSDGRFVSKSPKVSRSKVQRIIVFENWVGLLGDCFQISNSLEQGRLLVVADLGGCKCRGASNESRKGYSSFILVCYTTNESIRVRIGMICAYKTSPS